MKTRFIEMVCEGNFTRSELARCIGRDYLDKIGQNRYDVTSSGLYVSISSEKRISMFPKNILDSLIKIGIEKDFFDDETREKVSQILCEKGDRSGLERYLLQAGRKYQDLENVQRRYVAFELGISGEFKEKRNQTKINKNNVAVFAMDHDLTKGVRGIYKGSGYFPVIKTLGEYATGDSGAEIMSEIIGDSYERTYMEAVKRLQEYIPKAIDRVVGERL